MKYLVGQFLLSGVFIVVLSGLTYLIWVSDKNYEYASLGMSIHLILALLVALLFGTISLITLNRKKRPSRFIYWHNFVGIFNLILSVALGLFSYTDAGNKVDPLCIWALAPFILGMLILKEVYMKKVLRK